MPAEPRRGWQVLPLQTIEADVPLPYRIEAIGPAQTAVSINCGATVTIGHDGVVRNTSGTPIFRLAVLPPRGSDVR